MCGIAGYCGDFPENLLSAMSRRIAHRGPDDKGDLIIADEKTRWGLAHRRLSIIDLSTRARQPMTVHCPHCGEVGVEDSRCLWLIFNGEIYNYRELRAGLAARGHRFRTNSDSEVLLHLYSERGTKMLSELNGIFAFALYDGRTSGRPDGIEPGDLLLARDGIGVKPLYYACTRAGFLFASELKALLADDALSTDLDPIALHYYLAYLWTPAPRTPLKSVKKLEPGAALVVRRGEIARQWHFYRLPFGTAVNTAREIDIQVELQRHIQAAVKRQLVADVPVGAFLSGGLDSSAVVAMMRRAQPDVKPVCYCVAFGQDVDMEGSPADLPYARKAAEFLDVDLRVIAADPGMIDHLNQMLFLLDEPQADPSPINALLIAAQARKDGVKVLLSGAGGDDIFSGYRRHQALYLEQWWNLLPRAVSAPVAALLEQALTGVASKVRRFPAIDHRTRRAQKLLQQLRLQPEERFFSYFLWSPEFLRRSLYTSEFASRLADTDTLAPLRQSLSEIPSKTDALNKMLYLETRHFLADHNLNYTDKMSMACGIEVRVPLLDTELVRYAAAIPGKLKQNLKTGKAIFKKAMRPYLPPGIIKRPKSGFGAPLRRWMHVELANTVNEVLSDTALGQRGIFDPRAVRKLIDLDRRRVVDATYTLFGIMCIEMWCRIFIDNRGTL